MRVPVLVAIMLLVLPVSLAAGDDDPPGRGPARSPADTADTGVHYNMRARLWPEKRLIQGWLQVRLRNNPATSPLAGKHLLKEVRFHLYLNGFSGPDTLFMREGRGRMRYSRFDPEQPGWIKVLSVYHAQTVLKHRLLEDGTVLAVDLEEPLGPGEDLSLMLEFESRLPRVFARTGFAGDFFMVGQWYPKLGFLRRDGTWHCPPYHPFEEYFAPFASYAVELTLPYAYRVAATGTSLEKRRAEDVLAVHRLRAVGVHDFAFAAWPTFSRSERFISGVRVSLSTVPGRGADERIFAATAQGLERLQRWFFPYPYEQLSVVDVPTRAMGAGGMEYPTLFTTWTPRWVPGWHHGVDILVLHELTHQYFQGMVASDEVEQPWLDEGVTTYVTGLLADQAYGADRSIMDLGPVRLGHHQLRRLSAMRDGKRPRPVGSAARSFPTASAYSRTVYSRAALMLATVEDLMGRPAMLKALGAYARRHAFGHPGTFDLIDALVAAAPEASREAVRLLVMGVVHGKDQVLDYGITCEAGAVRVRRAGDLRLPLELNLRLSGGRLEKRKLTGEAREETVEIPAGATLAGATLGPARRLGLDPTPLDLSCEVDQGAGTRHAAWRWTSLLQLIMQMLGP